MRENGYLCQKGDYYNQPTQKAMKLGLFELKKTSITKPDGSVLVTTTTKVSGKGQIYFIDKFLAKDKVKSGEMGYYIHSNIFIKGSTGPTSKI